MMIPLFKPYVPLEGVGAVSKVLRSGWMGLGSEVDAFEEEFSIYVGCRYAIAVNSGTAALNLAVHYLKALSGRMVITTPNTFVSTNHVLLQNGFEPVFADINPNTGNIDPQSIDRLFKKHVGRIAAIMVVHYGGLPVDTIALHKEYGIHIIEDAAHACGSTFKGLKIGNLGSPTCFSFHAVKNLNVGDGGMITTNNARFAQWCYKMRWLGIDKTTISRTTDKQYSWDYNVEGVGFKCHMNDVIAALGRVQLRALDRYNSIRRRINDQYRAELQGVTFMDEPTEYCSALHLFVIRSPKKAQIMEALTKAEIGFGYHYKPNYAYNMYKFCLTDNGCPGMEEFQRTAISLPMHLYLKQEDVTKICDVVNKAVRR